MGIPFRLGVPCPAQVVVANGEGGMGGGRDGGGGDWRTEEKRRKGMKRDTYWYIEWQMYN